MGLTEAGVQLLRGREPLQIAGSIGCHVNFCGQNDLNLDGNGYNLHYELQQRYGFAAVPDSNTAVYLHEGVTMDSSLVQTSSMRRLAHDRGGPRRRSWRPSRCSPAAAAAGRLPRPATRWPRASSPVTTPPITPMSSRRRRRRAATRHLLEHRPGELGADSARLPEEVPVGDRDLRGQPGQRRGVPAAAQRDGHRQTRRPTCSSPTPCRRGPSTPRSLRT